MPIAGFPHSSQRLVGRGGTQASGCERFRYGRSAGTCGGGGAGGGGKTVTDGRWTVGRFGLAISFRIQVSWPTESVPSVSIGSPGRICLLQKMHVNGIVPHFLESQSLGP